MKKFFLIAALLMILILPTTANAKADWVWVASDDYNSLWIDWQRVIPDSCGERMYDAAYARVRGK